MKPDLKSLLEKDTDNLRGELSQDAVFCWACAPVSDFPVQVRSNRGCQITFNGCGYLPPLDSPGSDLGVTVVLGRGIAFSCLEMNLDALNRMKQNLG